MQYSFWKNRVTHGGDTKGKRKERRPVATKRVMHVTMKASQARGKWSLLRNENRRYIEMLVDKLSRKWRVKIYELSVNGNHIHLAVRPHTRDGFANFFRVLSARVASKVTGATRGKALETRFWDRLLWSRIVEWGKAFRIATRYVVINRHEGLGLVAYTAREFRPARE